MAVNRVNTEVPEKVTTSLSSAPSRHIPSAESDAVAKRIAEIIGDQKVSWFAKECGFGESLLRKYLQGAQPNTSNLVSMANAGGVTVDWLATGRLPKTRSSLADGGYARPEPSAPQGTGEARADYVAIPLYSEIRAAAGYGVVNGHAMADDALMFKEEWIRHELGARPQDLWLIRVHGDSMEPTLRAGDVILVDSRASRPDREGIYILRLGDALLVKRLQVMPGRKIRVTSDNTAFEPWMIDQEGGGDDMAIIGRVVWSGRRM